MARTKLSSKASAYHINNRKELQVAGCQTTKVMMCVQTCVTGCMLSSDDLLYDKILAAVIQFCVMKYFTVANRRSAMFSLG